MAKALKTVGMVVGVVALAATGIGLAGGLGIMAASTAMSIGMIASVAAGVIGVAAGLMARKPGFSQEGNPQIFQTNPQSGLPYAIGRTRMSGLRIHGDTADSPQWKSESKDDVLAFAVLLSAGGTIEGIESFRADKEAVSFDPATGAASGNMNGWMAQKWWLGGAMASALALSFGGISFPGWTADHKLSGMTHALWTLRGDPKGEKFGAGPPGPEWIGKWVKVYDPRKDSTFPGGSGSHRALDESTYEWSENPALHALTWALGRWQNGKRTLGVGAPAENIRIGDFVEAANVADANDWRCGGVEWSTDSKWTILKRMLQAGGAEPTMTGAMIGCRVNAPVVSIATVTGDDLLDDLSMPTTRSRRDRFNTVIPRYRSEEHDWEVISGSPVSVPAYVGEDGGPRTKEIDFPLVQHQSVFNGNKQAGELAAYEIVNSREAGPWRFTTGPKFVGVKTGDCITIDLPDEGVPAQPVIVRARSIDPATLKITFEVETETDAKHDFALGRTTVPPPTYSPTPPDLTPPIPSPALWSLTAEVPGEVTPSILISGVCEFPGADSVLLEYKTLASPDWLTLGKAEASAPVSQVVSSLVGSTAYVARVAYQSGQRVGDWLELGPVITGVDRLGEFFEDYNGNNNRNPDPIPAPTFFTNGSGVDHTLNENGSANIVSRWTFADKDSIDGYEFILHEGLTNANYIPGTGEEQSLVIVGPVRTSQTVMGVSPNHWFTPAVRAWRKVDTDVHPDGIIFSPWAKPTLSSENPYRPSVNVAFSGNLIGTINGVSATSVAAAVTNFNEDNDGNGLTPPAATGVQYSGIQFPDASGQITVPWTYTNSSDPAAANNIDGFLVGLRVRESSAAYIYNPADIGIIRWQEARPDQRSMVFGGIPVNWYATPIVIPFRRVRADVALSNIIMGPAAQRSPNVPLQLATAPNFTGNLAGVLAGDVTNWATRASVALNPDGTVSTGKVLTGSILEDAINQADWAAEGNTLSLATNDAATSVILDVFSTGSHMRAQFVVDYQAIVVNPAADSEMDFTIEIWVRRVSNSADYYSTALTLSEIWNAPTASGTKRHARKTVGFEYIFEGLPAGAYYAGYRIRTNATGGVTLRPYRFLRASDERASQ